MKIKPYVFLCFCVCFSLAFPLFGQAPIPVEFQVNPENPAAFFGDLYLSRGTIPRVAMEAGGRFVIAWRAAPGNAGPLLARVYSPDAEPLTGELVLAGGRRVVVACDASGFLLAWTRESETIAARRFTFTGEPIGEEITVNASDAFPLNFVDLALQDDGGFVIVWDSVRQDGDGKGIFARAFRGDGAPRGEEFQVNTTTAGPQRVPSVAVDGNGDFTIVWESSGQDGEGWGVYARRFARDGSALTGEILVNATTDGDQHRAAVAQHTDGSFVVAWTNDDLSSDDIIVRFFTGSGQARGNEIEIPADQVIALRFDPRIRYGDAEVLVSWTNHGGIRAGPGQSGSLARYVAESGELMGGDFHLGRQLIAGPSDLAGNGSGDFIAVFLVGQRVLARLLPADTRAGTLHLVFDRLDVAEAQAAATLQVMRTGGAVGDVAADLVVTGGTATPNEDFQDVIERLVVPETASALPLDFQVQLLDDETVEGDEDLILRLEGVGAPAADPTIAHVHLLDDDFNPPFLRPVVKIPERAVNTRIGNNSDTAVAVAPNGDIAVVWDNQSQGIFARVFTPDGRPRGPERRISGSNSQAGSPDVVADGESGYVMFWKRFTPLLLEGRRLDPRGVPGESFSIPADCGEPATRPDGSTACQISFTYSWLEDGTIAGRPAAFWEIVNFESRTKFLKRALIGRDDIDVDILIEAAFEERIGGFATAIAADNSSLVTWRQNNNRRAQRYDSVGELLDTSFILPEPEHAFDLDHVLAVDGQFVSAWGNDDQIFARRFLRRRAQGDLFRVPNFPAGRFHNPVMAAGPAEHFVIAWTQNRIPSEDGSGSGVFARRFNKAWGPVGGEIRLNATTLNNQGGVDVAMGPDGTLVAAWGSDRDQIGESDILLQSFEPFACVPPDPAAGDGRELCLQEGRFRLEVEWRDFAGQTGRGRAAPLLTRDTGYFWFFSPDNVELVVKVLDGRAFNGHYWVFYGSLSDVGYTLTVTDLLTGEVRVYDNPPGRFASLADDEAFPGDDLGWSSVDGSGARTVAAPELASRTSPALKGGGCVGDDLHLCLGGRFELEIHWRDFADQTGPGQAVPITTDTGYFWFFSPSNVEVVVKVLDGRAFNGYFWVFYGGLSDVEYTLVVRDTVTGNVREYFNPLLRAASVGDTEALPGE